MIRGERLEPFPVAPPCKEMNMNRTIENQSQIHGFSVAPSVTREAASKFLCVSIRTLERLEKSKQLLPIRIGRSVSYDLADLVAFRESKKVA